ncbi:twin-arginine translocase TatA/TatE family subunit [Acidiphilium sp. AL]|uniref:Sec-independent protein translocase protein TatA n=1 Tax=Acidiphilium iwatense TaxID=768198 RepID=A0ABS9DW02_9PROT|nr:MULTISPECIES: twin-arginine translocase TatA/TatE family subunit [Acidiphilium]MCF3946926.1 twin-arginine translocase TatA/TatE family subunit [Acidiphilium iwatense]MCU4159769.1 twin-arginine translocase TatA/TatE family subunit [Acidiphilium sp. AL]
MGGLSIWHWLIVLAVVLILFGTGRVGNLMGELGKGMKSFRNNLADDQPKDASMLEQHVQAPAAQAGSTTTTERNRG